MTSGILRDDLLGPGPTDGLPQGYRGYGPNGESDVVKDGVAYTYDDLGETVQFVYFFFGRQSFWTEKGLKLSDEPLLRQYEGTHIRKSTGRFVQRRDNFDASPSPLTMTYKEQCFSTKEIR